jgi:hypothetical protein
MPTDRGYVVVVSPADEASSTYICSRLGADGRPTEPYAVHSRVGEPILEAGVVLEQDGNQRFSREVLQVYVPEDSSGVRISHVTSPGSALLREG